MCSGEAAQCISGGRAAGQVERSGHCNKTRSGFVPIQMAVAFVVCRELVDGGYEVWVRAIMAAVEAAGAVDAKHGTRLRLENYAFLQLGLQVRAELWN